MPKETSADVLSILSSAFQRQDLKKMEEIALVDRNLQNMSLLSSPRISDTSASSTENARQQLKSASVLVAGMALTNENMATVKGTTDLFDKDINSDKISLYTVRSGDSIEQIAQMFKVNVSTILWANDLKRGTALKPDQVLVIMPISGLKYVVKKGDSLQSIANAYKGDISEIAQFNNLEDDATLAVGDELVIPDATGLLASAENDKKTQEDKKLAAKKTVKVGISGSVTTRGSDTSGYFSKPVSGGTRTQGVHGNNGIDIAAPLGTAIRAAASGRVVIARNGGWNGGYGSYVVIQHDNGTQTLYGHMNSVSTSVGETVSKGETIGGMGNTGQSTGVHLHFEVRGGRNPF